jgi:hypothetical protein
MPLASLLATLGMLLTGARTFAAARLGFLLLAALLPVLTAKLSFALTRRRDLALLAGILAAVASSVRPLSLPNVLALAARAAWHRRKRDHLFDKLVAAALAQIGDYFAHGFVWAFTRNQSMSNPHWHQGHATP